MLSKTYFAGILFIYLIAFTSLYVQIPGLYGVNGLTPLLNNVEKYSDMNFKQLLSEFTRSPTLFVFLGLLPLSPEAFMEVIAIFGILLSLTGIVFSQMRSMGMFALLWVLYLSCYKVGQVFMWFQWDILLLEAGFLTIFTAPLGVWIRKDKINESDVTKRRMMFFLVRWLLFRLMFASGVVKLTSGCPTWWSLTALNYHYESQCIPTPLAWYVHQLPEWFQKLSVVATYYIEILVPFFFFVPIKAVRYFAFICQVFFQLCIITSGNYNFFNLLTIVLCLSLLDTNNTNERKSKIFPYVWKALFLPVKVIVISVLILLSVYYTSYIFGTTISLKEMLIKTEITFTYQEFERWVTYAVRIAALQAVLVFGYEMYLIVCRFLRAVSLSNGVACLYTVVLGGLLFAVSLVPLSVLDSTFYHSLPKGVIDVYNSVDKISICNTYGLFRRMTGVGGRPEVVIEGANSLNEDWREFEFVYKPGDVNRPPPFVFPHQPRLDWQMWFAALGSYQQNPWIVHLVYRLLIGEPAVLKLMGPQQPFKKPPLYIRAKLYLYHFTPAVANCQGNNCSSSNWWTRTMTKEYIPPLHWQEPTLIDFLKHQGYLSGKDYKPPINIYTKVLDWIRHTHEDIPHHVLVWIMIAMALVFNMITSYFKV